MKQITKKQKIWLSALATVCSLAAFALLVPITVSSDGLQREFTTEDLAKKSQVIVIGKVVDSKSDLIFQDNDPTKPFIWTTTYVKPEKFIKGSDTAPLLEIKTIGGKVNNIVYDSDDPKLEKGDRLLLFLNKEPNSIYGDKYYVSGVTQGKYALKNGMAENDDEKRNISETELLTKINQASGK